MKFERVGVIYLVRNWKITEKSRVGVIYVVITKLIKNQWLIGWRLGWRLGGLASNSNTQIWRFDGIILFENENYSVLNLKNQKTVKVTILTELESSKCWIYIFLTSNITTILILANFPKWNLPFCLFWKGKKWLTWRFKIFSFWLSKKVYLDLGHCVFNTQKVLFEELQLFSYRYQLIFDIAQGAYQSCMIHTFKNPLYTLVDFVK